MEWLQDASREDEDCILSLMLPTLTNLRSIDVEIQARYVYVARQLDRAGLGQHPFDKKPTFSILTDVMIASYNEGNGLDINAIVGAFTLPAIKNIYLHRVSSFVVHDNSYSRVASMLKNIKYGSSHVKSIDMRNCQADAYSLSHIMRAPKALMSFCYELD